jgi:hypothetical protein
MASKCLGTIKKFNETGALMDKTLLLIKKDHIEDTDDGCVAEDNQDYVLETKFAFVQRNMKGNLVTVALSDPDEELPSDLADADWDELELYEVIDKTSRTSAPTYRELADWILDGEYRVLLDRNSMVRHTLDYKLSEADKPANDIVKYNEDFRSDEGWEDIMDLQNDEETGYWKIAD